MPPVVGRAAPNSAITKLTMHEKPPTIVQLAKAAFGPPVYITQPKRTGMPEIKFIEVNVAAIDSNKPKHRTNSCL